METSRGFWASLWNLLCFLPFFSSLLILGFIKVTIGISGTILFLWPMHCFYTYYCILSTKQFGPVLKLIICICLAAALISWPPIGVACSVLSGAAYGHFSPILATFQAVGEGKSSKLSHCICDGTWSGVEGSFTMITDFSDVCCHSYLSIMDDLLHHEGERYEIRLLHVPLALVAGAAGVVVDLPVISELALCKSHYMLVKGWHRLLQDCVGREGPFLETICVPFAGLAVLLWPLVVAAAVVCSIVSSVFLGAYAAVVVYQESSIWLGLCYIVASVSMYDEYSNDVLDMPEGSLFPRPRYREKASPLPTSLSIRSSPPSPRASRMLELADALFKECQRLGEVLVSEGTIKLIDVEEAMNRRMLTVGLPAYCILQTFVRSARADCGGILLSKPKDEIYEWFLNPLLIIKEQIKAASLSEMEEHYLGKLVLFSGDAMRLKSAHVGPEPESEVERAELEALGRRLIGITKSILRYPTFRRRFDQSMRDVLAQLGKKSGNSKARTLRRSVSMFARVITRKHGSGQEDPTV
ncbi:hypothetical protein SASPL_118324 [Salvia splendens]|uniref:Steroid nuclear receptor ligand-binding n=1 Tax=Salvia splendens TaxID=180675 RepID=A0A8X8ZYC4_SALSN|nr:hypothetical protein SASPL_118324 [Salvia splendens]